MYRCNRHAVSTVLKKMLDLCAAPGTYTKASLEYRGLDKAMDTERVKGE